MSLSGALRRVVVSVRAPLLALGGLLLCATLASAAPSFPALTGRVVDDAHILGDASKAELTAKLAALETATHRQLVVVTLPNLQGYEIADYGYQLGRHWGIGQKGDPKAPAGTEKDNGVLFIVAPTERKVRIEVGYGLEPVLTDALSATILQGQVLPRFKAGDMPGGVVAGTEAIVSQLGLPDDQAKALAQAASSQAAARPASSGNRGSIWPAIIIFLVFFLLSRRRGGWIAPAVIGGLASRSDWGGSSGGGGGGGFSGGGGSFGGGGASGGW